MVVYDKYYLKTKEKPQYAKKKESIYCLGCKTKTDNKNIKRVALKDKIGQQKSMCLDYDCKKSTFFNSNKTNEKQKLVFTN